MHDWRHYQGIVFSKVFLFSFHLIFPAMLKHPLLNFVFCGITLPLVLCISHPHLHLECYLLSNYFEGCSLHPNLFSSRSKDLFLSAVQKRNQTKECKKMLSCFHHRIFFFQIQMCAAHQKQMDLVSAAIQSTYNKFWTLQLFN